MITCERPNENLYTLQSLNLGHLKRLTTEIGVWQHCKGAEPNVDHGYSIDDVARALIVAVELWQRGIERQYVEILGATCLNFLEKAALPDGKFHNFADRNGNWVDIVGSEDSFGRTLWALALAHKADVHFASASRIQPLLDLAMKHVSLLGPLRSRAFVLQALSYLPSEMCEAAPGLLKKLEDAFADHRTPDWVWYEPTMTYCNGRVPIALFLGSKFSPRPEETIRDAQLMLDFLLKSTAQREIGGYAPIGNNGWFNKGDAQPPLFDQQPVDTGVLVEACALAAQYCQDEKYHVAALDAMDWYHGRNVHELSIYDERSGGVFDALTPTGVNFNQGAESVLSYCLAAIALDDVA